jgi:hypothetical protein
VDRHCVDANPDPARIGIKTECWIRIGIQTRQILNTAYVFSQMAFFEEEALERFLSRVHSNVV